MGLGLKIRRLLSVQGAIVLCILLIFNIAACKKREISISIVCESSVEVTVPLKLSALVRINGETSNEVVAWSVADRTGSDCGAIINESNELIAQRTGWVVVRAFALEIEKTREIEIKPMGTTLRAADYKTAFADVLALDTDSVVIANKVRILAAMNSYHSLDLGTKALLEDEIALLNELLAMVEAYEAKNSFLTAHATVLGLNVAGVTYQNKSLVVGAYAVFSGYSELIKSLLVEQGELLQSLKARADKLFLNEADANLFKSQFAELLALEPEDIELEHAELLGAAATKYSSYDSEVKDLLSAEYAHINSLYSALGILQAVEGFFTINATLLEMQISEVDEQNMNAIIDAYNAFTQQLEEVQYIIENEYQAQFEIFEGLYLRAMQLKGFFDDANEFRISFNDLLNTQESLISSFNYLSYKDQLNNAIAQFEQLEQQVQDILIGEYEKLVDLRLIVADCALEEYLLLYSELLQTEPSALAFDDFSQVSLAIFDLDQITDSYLMQIWGDTRRRLEELEGEVSKINLQISTFLSQNAQLLLLADGDVQESIRFDLNNAISDYNALDARAKAQLIDAYTRLNELLNLLPEEV